MVYTAQAGRGQLAVLGVISAFFFVIAVFAYHQNQITALFFAGFGLWNALYVAVKLQTWLRFQPDNPAITIKKGLARPITIQPSDCIKLGTNSGRVTSPKLTYRVNGRSKNIVIYTPNYEVSKAWATYSHTYLQAIKTEQLRQADMLVERILESPTEDYYDEHFNKK